MSNTQIRSFLISVTILTISSVWSPFAEAACLGQTETPGSCRITTAGVTRDNVTCIGTSGDDIITCTNPLGCVIHGKNGNDTIYGNASVSPTGAAASNTICGGEGNDSLIGGKGADNIYGGLGDDDIMGGPVVLASGKRTVAAGSGIDKLYGSFGDDTIDGGDGNDTICGDNDDDTLYGGDGDDTAVDGGLGNDTVDGGRNNALSSTNRGDQCSAPGTDDTVVKLPTATGPVSTCEGTFTQSPSSFCQNWRGN